MTTCANRAHLARITTRLAVDRLRHVRARREVYAGPRRPEPLVTDPGATVEDSAQRAVLAASGSRAVLVVLESRSPLERAVCVPREAFGFPYGEIAATPERQEPTVRQLSGRARRHVAERGPRFGVDPAERRDLTERFPAAASGGDLDALLALLTPDVRLVGDNGGKARAPLRVMESADKAARFLFAAAEQPVAESEFRFLELNGGPALPVLSGSKPDAVLQLDVADGLIPCVYIIRNPGKPTAFAP
ncbi:RNA polymerase sigma-70 factor [Streptomyces enissocaesilis]|uniref:RNA polymerase sigma-70 factor n=1 Tax=Streptomyces enissocaesilis TaxID=332589 RepID=A0ABP6JKL0_9ACTN